MAIALAQPELFDVIVVAARGAGPGPAAQLAQTIARRFGLSPGAVALGLDRGGIEIHRGLVKAEAIAAARALHELGAVAEVRAARDASGVLMIEPDADAIPTAITGAPGSAEAAGLPPAPPFGIIGEPARDAMRAPPRPTTGPQSMLPSQVSTGPQPVVQPPRTAAPRPASPTPRPAAATTPRPAAPRSASAPSRTEPPRVDPPRVDPPRVDPPRVEPPRAARASGGAVRSETRSPTAPRIDPRADPEPPSRTAVADTNTPLDPDAPAIPRGALGEAPTSSRFAPPTAGERVELDLAAAGLAQAPVGTSALARARSESSGVGRRPSGEVPIASESATRMPSESMRTRVPAEASTRAPIPAFEAPATPGLLAPDRVLSVLIAATLGAVLGLVVAFGWVRGDAARTCETLEGELQASVADPIGVEEGRARPPDTIVAELQTSLADLRSRFWLVWAVIALPIAAAGAIPKPGR